MNASKTLICQQNFLQEFKDNMYVYSHRTLQCSVCSLGFFTSKLATGLLAGLVHKSQMANSRVESPEEMVEKGETVYCKVISSDVRPFSSLIIYYYIDH